MTDKKTELQTALAAAIVKATETAPTKTPTAPIIAAAEVSVDDLMDDHAPGEAEDLATSAAGNGLTADQLFSRVIFKLTPEKEVFASDDGKRFSRKVADVKVELAGSGFYLAGSISEVQNITETTPHREFAWLYSRQSRTSAISYAEKGSRKQEMDEWKDRTLDSFEQHCALLGVVPGQPRKVEHKHIVAGVSLINPGSPAPTADPKTATK